jgi:dynein heavy chain
LKNNFTQLEKLVNKEFLKETMELGKEFDSLNNDLASNIISEMKEDIEKFREKLWLIELLTTDALIKKPHYWKEISEACKLSKENKLEPND